MTPTLFRLIAAGGVLGVLEMSATAYTPQESGSDRAAVLKVFEERVGAYVALHRRIEQPLPPPESSGRTRSLLLRRIYLASAIKNARPNARQGDIFTPPVADFLRRTIAIALKEADVELTDPHPYGKYERLDFHPGVYDPYPDWATHEMPTILLSLLPRLPDDVAYGLLDRDLVLWDVHADLIVDVLPDAIPRAGS